MLAFAWMIHRAFFRLSGVIEFDSLYCVKQMGNERAASSIGFNEVAPWLVTFSPNVNQTTLNDQLKDLKVLFDLNSLSSPAAIYMVHSTERGISMFSSFTIKMPYNAILTNSWQKLTLASDNVFFCYIITMRHLTQYASALNCRLDCEIIKIYKK